MSKILIIDDDADSRLILSAQLRTKGYNTVFAVDAVGAMVATKREVPDLVILDLGLPGGDGLLLIDHLASLSSLAPIPIVVVSGRDPEVAKPKALAAGAAAFVAKPANPKELLAIIETHLRVKSEADLKANLARDLDRRR